MPECIEHMSTQESLTPAFYLQSQVIAGVITQLIFCFLFFLMMIEVYCAI